MGDLIKLLYTVLGWVFDLTIKKSHKNKKVKINQFKLILIIYCHVKLILTTNNLNIYLHKYRN